MSSKWDGVSIRLDMRKRGKYYYDADAAETACRFFPRYLRHWQGEFSGREFELEPWQSELIIKPLFGWKRTDTGLRRFRRVFVEVAKKNGKSTLGGGLALQLLLCDGEAGAEVYSAAADREQARIVFEHAKCFVNAAPQLLRRVQLYRNSIYVPETMSAYKVLSADVKTKHGPNIHALIFDELHAQPNRNLWDTLIAGIAARRQPVVFAITTAGFDRSSICYEQYQYARKIRDGIVKDDTYLPVIFEADPDSDLADVRQWRRANPSLDVTLKRSFLAEEARAAKESPAKQNVFKRLHLNLWTEQEERWVDMAAWDRCNTAPVDAEALRGENCFAGLDMASTQDIIALALVFYERDPMITLLYFWVPEETAVRRARKEQIRYDTWIAQGWMHKTEGNLADYDVIREAIKQVASMYRIREIGYDRWNASQLVTQLTNDGAVMVPIGQGFASMTAPAKEFERLVLGGGLNHGGNPVLRWMMSNCAVTQDPAGNLKPAKDKSADKIDGIVAIIMALARSIVAKSNRSIYETRGIISIGGEEVVPEVDKPVVDDNDQVEEPIVC